MCGIAGVIAPRGIEAKRLDAMSAALQHRGPDGYGAMVYAEPAGIRLHLNRDLRDAGAYGSVAFVHRRLSIIDLSAASLQPMADETGTYCIVYNGEIYNYLELRAELQGLGYRFTTAGDTEVLLRAWEAWGPDCLRRLNGMWAFALLDRRHRRVILSRDRYGIKPLYSTLRNNSLYFASELKGLLAVSAVKPAPNERTVTRYLLTGLVDDGEDTFFEDVAAFPAGHWGAISLDCPTVTLTRHRYASFPTETFQGTEREAVERFRELFVDAVRVHSRSDVPVGTCLSGGLDSSAIVCAAETLRERQEIPEYAHRAFGYCASDDRYNERRHMEAVVAATSVRMHYVDVSPQEFRAALPEILRVQDEPVGSASIAAQWFVFQRAKAEGMKVMLDGQGSDETLGGYHGYFVDLAASRLRRRDLAGYRALRATYEREIGPFPLSGLAAARMLAGALVPVLAHLARRLRRAAPPGLLQMALGEALSARDGLDGAADEARPSSLNEKLQRDVQALVLPALLRYEDRNSMAHSIEARVPFLDHRLVEFVFTLPEAWKINGATTKYILREALRGILPEAVRTRRDKIGFKVAPNLTFDFVREHRDALLHNQTDFEERWFRARGLERLFESGDRSVEAEFSLWRVLNTKLWARQFWGAEARCA